MSWLTTPLYVAADAAAVFAASELGSRMWLKQRGRAYVWVPHTRMEMHLDATALPDLPTLVRHSINRDGERGDEPPTSREGLYRVLVAGGSAAECYLIDQQDSWPAVLQAELSQPARLAALRASRVHVGNVARSLVTCRHVDVILDRILPTYEKLDAIVFMVGASDVVHWLEKRAPEVIVDELIPPQALFALHPYGPFGWKPKTLALRRLATYWHRRISRPVEKREQVGKRLLEVRRMRAEAKEVLDRCPDPAPMLEHFDHGFRALLRRAQAKARTVLVVRQPWLEKQFTQEEHWRLWSFAAGRPYAGRVDAYWSHAVAWKLLAAVDARAEQIAREMGAAQLDLMPKLEPSFDIYYDEMHHNVEGNRQVGAHVAHALLEALRRNGGARAD